MQGKLIHFNRAVYQAGSQEYVCSLIVADDSLYVVRTGSTGALVSDNKVKNINQTVGMGDTQGFVEELARNEAALADKAPEDLLRMPDSFAVPLNEIDSVKVGVQDTPEADIPTMIIVSKRGVFQFQLNYLRDEELRMLQETLTRGA